MDYGGDREKVCVSLFVFVSHLYFFIYIWVGPVLVEIEGLDAAFVRKCFGKRGVVVLRKNFIISIIQHEVVILAPWKKENFV